MVMGGRVLGEIEEYFAETMVHGDTFVFAGEVLRFEGIVEDSVLVSRTAPKTDPKVPSYAGGKFPLSTHLAARVRAMLGDPKSWKALPDQVADWLAMQQQKSLLPKPGDLLVETFPRSGRFHLVAYPFEGRLAHQTLGMLLTRRLERARMKPQGFVCNDYALSVWGLGDIALQQAREPGFIGRLFDQEMLGDDLEEWLAESALMKRTFRYCAVISGLIQRNFPGQEKKSRQITMSTDLVYDVLRSHEPDHILLRAARDDAATGLLDIRRLSDMLSRIKGRIIHKALERVSPLAVPVLLEIGREAVYGEARDALLEEAARELVAEVMG
jgi:ATP-dependent helicase Lhr and Lhr-like helicase